MSNENQTPTTPTEPAQRSDSTSPFLNSPLPQGTPQGQQQSLQQEFNDAPISNVPKYNLPRGAGKTGNVGDTTHFGYQTVKAEDKAQKWPKCSTPWRVNTTS